MQELWRVGEMCYLMRNNAKAMKKRVKLFALALMGVLIYACGGNSEKESITIVSYEVIDAQYDAEPPVVKFEGEEIDYNIYTKAEFSDGSWAHYIECYGPINSVAEFFDSKGKRISTWSRASECFTQYIVYNYDEQGRLQNMRYLYFEEIEDGYKYRDGYNMGYDNPDAINEKYDKIARDSMEVYFGNCEHLDWIEADSLGVVTFRNKIEQLDYSVVDTFWCSQVNFEYDKQGELARVYEIPKADIYGDNDEEERAPVMDECVVHEIVATDEYDLTYAIKPVESFWASDINGGKYYLEVNQVSQKDDENLYVKRYVNMCTAYEKWYRYGKLIKYKLYPDANASDEDQYWVMATVEESDEGDTIIKTQLSNSEDVTIDTWKGGKKVSSSLYSKYGTELKRTTYGYVKTGVNMRYYNIDFKTKKMKFISNRFNQFDEIFSVDDIPTIEDAMKLEYHYRNGDWYNYDL